MNRYEFKGERPLRTKVGRIIARDFERIVHGGRGAYVEIANKDIITEELKLVSAPHSYYKEFRTGTDRVKFYYQLRTVKYADYKVGFWYVSPRDLQGFEVVKKVLPNKPDIPTYCLICKRINGTHDEGCPNANR